MSGADDFLIDVSFRLRRGDNSPEMPQNLAIHLAV